MYREGGGYHVFAGKDVSVALGKMKFDKEFMEPEKMYWEDSLNAQEMTILNDWEKFFLERYHVVANIDESYRTNKKKNS
eukprot:CAMPEP_0170557382 /NCGR_PEP_ID=MMETSP0211-20121228/24821_1 /TAXON_ID=311385 /ORGANISM="Pseudokeronopsis sp., Strain OXSARD2" /LENGTH=78 /DNA_ID=CAMNT_0010868349 /DNA_START=180 /DNA_END=416 /DNA_ORIENTATION=-